MLIPAFRARRPTPITPRRTGPLPADGAAAGVAVASALAWWLGEHLGAEIDLRPRPDQVPALAEERDQQWRASARRF